jgi:hypothetical protein
MGHDPDVADLGQLKSGVVSHDGSSCALYLCGVRLRSYLCCIRLLCCSSFVVSFVFVAVVFCCGLSSVLWP